MSQLSYYLSNQIHFALDAVEHLHVKSDSEYLHQFRVRLRRSISLLKLFRPHSRLRQKLKKLIKITNKIRDLDVLFDAIDSELYPQLSHYIFKYRNKLFKKRLTKQWRYTTRITLQLVEKKLLHQGKGKESHHHLKHRAIKHYKKTITAYKKLTSEDHEDRYHDVRINFKISRYGLAFIQNAKISSTSKQISCAKRYQELLGIIQDLSQQIKLLQELCKKKPTRDCTKVLVDYAEKLHLIKKGQ